MPILLSSIRHVFQSTYDCDMMVGGKMDLPLKRTNSTEEDSVVPSVTLKRSLSTEELSDDQISLNGR